MKAEITSQKKKKTIQSQKKNNMTAKDKTFVFTLFYYF